MAFLSFIIFEFFCSYHINIGFVVHCNNLIYFYKGFVFVAGIPFSRTHQNRVIQSSYSSNNENPKSEWYVMYSLDKNGVQHYTLAEDVYSHYEINST